ncbi:hypothetical protein [Stenotrophomonas sp. JAI102]|uniref:hypothetical protein n=1 Tax=Stenotrophomonas sp. JAI102 TaxID=2723077 RepID=UPI0015CC9235|nr:hypothetical protein [Stenotrophomonas sp. JAI102]NYF35013.1 hypothetical protein [Stenotrophomonas sp. JAI102]
MYAELIIARSLKLAAIAAAFVACFVLARNLVSMSCPLDAYPPSVLAAMYVAVLMLMVYSRFKFASRGLVKLPASWVGRVLGAVVAVELVGVGVLLAWNRDCGSIVRALPVPAALLIFYTTVGFSLLFGDAHLGILRNVIRLGVKPKDFLRDGDLR